MTYSEAQDGGWDAYCMEREDAQDRCPCQGSGQIEVRDVESGNSYRARCDCPAGERLDLQRRYYELVDQGVLR